MQPKAKGELPSGRNEVELALLEAKPISKKHVPPSSSSREPEQPIPKQVSISEVQRQDFESEELAQLPGCLHKANEAGEPRVTSPLVLQQVGGGGPAGAAAAAKDLGQD